MNDLLLKAGLDNLRGAQHRQCALLRANLAGEHRVQLHQLGVQPRPLPHGGPVLRYASRHSAVSTQHFVRRRQQNARVGRVVQMVRDHRQQRRQRLVAPAVSHGSHRLPALDRDVQHVARAHLLQHARHHLHVVRLPITRLARRHLQRRVQRLRVVELAQVPVPPRQLPLAHRLHLHLLHLQLLRQALRLLLLAAQQRARQQRLRFLFFLLLPITPLPHSHLVLAARGHHARARAHSDHVARLCVSLHAHTHGDGHRQQRVGELEVVRDLEGHRVDHLHAAVQTRRQHALHAVRRGVVVRQVTDLLLVVVQVLQSSMPQPPAARRLAAADQVEDVDGRVVAGEEKRGGKLQQARHGGVQRDGQHARLLR